MKETKNIRYLSYETMWCLHDEDVICSHNTYNCDITKKYYNYLTNTHNGTPGSDLIYYVIKLLN